MAELILTDEEKKADSFSEWDDASIGRLVKCLAIKQNNEADRRKVLYSHLASFALIAEAFKMGADTMRVEQNGVTFAGEPIGDWEVIARQIK